MHSMRLRTQGADCFVKLIATRFTNPGADAIDWAIDILYSPAMFCAVAYLVACNSQLGSERRAWASRMHEASRVE
jgi:hypothetical protein